MNPRELLSRLDAILADTVLALDKACVPVAQWVIETAEPSFDKCCDGLAYIRVLRINKVDTFYQQTTEPNNCDKSNGVLVELGVLRCAPTLSSSGLSPSAETISGSSMEVYEDAEVLYQVLQDQNPVWAQAPVAIEQWVPLSQDGGCVGGAWSFWMDAALISPNCEGGT